jgi:hypothetical protein
VSQGHGAIDALPAMWAFPKAKPQFFSPSPLALGASMCCYSFGRRLPRWQQSLLAAQALVPLVRRTFLTRVHSFAPVCGWELWFEWERWLRRREARVLKWVQLRSQWGKPRSSMLGLGRSAEPYAFVTVELEESAALHPSGATVTFRVPSLRDSAVRGPWILRSFDPVPSFHRTPNWDPELVAAVAEEASRLLEDEVERTADIPPHWRPMHGDFVPWNLREDRDGALWLRDWEDAGWAPPYADLVRYAVAHHSIRHPRARVIARTVRRAFPDVSAEAMAEAAAFWTRHPNLRRPDSVSMLSKGQAGDVARSRIEYDALVQLAQEDAEPMAATPIT